MVAMETRLSLAEGTGWTSACWPDNMSNGTHRVSSGYANVRGNVSIEDGPDAREFFERQSSIFRMLSCA